MIGDAPRIRVQDSMAIGSRLAWDDSILPFQLEGADCLGRVARLDGTLRRILAQHDYPAPIEALVAEAALLTALIGQTMRPGWKLSLQVRGKGPARLVATDYHAPETRDAPARIRAYASFDAARITPVVNPFDLIGEGYFAVMIDQGRGALPYQGYTPAEGGSIAACAETYFARSEQIPTRFAVACVREEGENASNGNAGGWRAGGVMLQHLPPAGGHAPGDSAAADAVLQTPRAPDAPVNGRASADPADNWPRANILLDTVAHDELIGPDVSSTDLLLRIFHDERPRVFHSQPVRFGCSCSEQTVRNAMSIYSQKDIGKMTNDAGVVTADCQFCGAHYELDPRTLGFEGTDAD